MIQSTWESLQACKCCHIIKSGESLPPSPLLDTVIGRDLKDNYRVCQGLPHDSPQQKIHLCPTDLVSDLVGKVVAATVLIELCD